MNDRTPSRGPLSRPRLALAMMLGVYPIITSLAYLIFPLTPDWPIFARTLVLVPLMVLAVVYFVTPTIHRLAGPWLHPPVYTPVLESEMVPEPLQEPVHS